MMIRSKPLTSRDRRRRVNLRNLSARLKEDATSARHLEAFYRGLHRAPSNTGKHTVTMPDYSVALLRGGRHVVEASAGAVALVGPNLGATTWRRQTCYLGQYRLNLREKP